MVDYKVKWIHNGKAEYITKKVGGLTWRDSLDSLGMELSFSMPFSRFDNQFEQRIKNGDVIVVYRKNKELLRCVITGVPINGDEYSGYDFAWYLNKSETIYQAKKVSAEKAIRQLCKRFDVPIGELPNMPTIISKLYKDMVVSDILKDILKKVKNETGQGYRMEMRKGKLNFVKSGYIKVKPVYTDRTGKKISCTKAASISGERSIEELRNQVIVAGTDEKKAQVKATAKSPASIKKYGLLQAVETKDKLSAAKARNVAKNKLKELNKEAVTFTAEMPGNNEVRAGRKLYFNFPEIGIKGWYKVKSCTHTVNNDLHWMSCEMEV